MADDNTLDGSGTGNAAMDALLKSISSIVDSDTSDALKKLQLMSLKNEKAVKESGALSPDGALDAQVKVLLKAVQTKAAELAPDLIPKPGDAAYAYKDGSKGLVEALFPEQSKDVDTLLSTVGKKVMALTEDAYAAIFGKLSEPLTAAEEAEKKAKEDESGESSTTPGSKLPNLIDGVSALTAPKASDVFSGFI